MIEDQQQQQKLSALLRLKRFEQPPPGYFDKLLQDVHRRQRAELLRRPLWQIAIERFQTFFGEHSMGRLQYGGAMAALLVAGLTALSFSFSPKSGSAPLAAIAEAPSSPAAFNLRADDTSRPRLLSLQEVQQAPMTVSTTLADEPVTNARLLPESATRQATLVGQTRYVIDARPASYEATTVSFSF